MKINRIRFLKIFTIAFLLLSLGCILVTSIKNNKHEEVKHYSYLKIDENTFNAIDADVKYDEHSNITYYKLPDGTIMNYEYEYDGDKIKSIKYDGTFSGSINFDYIDNQLYLLTVNYAYVYANTYTYEFLYADGNVYSITRRGTNDHFSSCNFYYQDDYVFQSCIVDLDSFNYNKYLAVYVKGKNKLNSSVWEEFNIAPYPLYLLNKIFNGKDYHSIVNLGEGFIFPVNLGYRIYSKKDTCEYHICSSEEEYLIYDLDRNVLFDKKLLNNEMTFLSYRKYKSKDFDSLAYMKDYTSAYSKSNYHFGSLNVINYEEELNKSKFDLEENDWKKSVLNNEDIITDFERQIGFKKLEKIIAE